MIRSPCVRGKSVGPRGGDSLSIIAPDCEHNANQWPTEPRLADVRELPPWVEIEPFIVTRYRVNYSPWQCLVSLFQLHNETWNIW